MVRQQLVPDHTVSFFSELVSRESTRYQALSPIPRGTIYAATVGADQRVIDIYPTLRFVREFAPYGSNSVNSMPGSEFVIWSWSSDPDAEGNYNAEITYLGDAVANPAYARISRIRREVYEASPTVALGTAYTALIGIKVTAGGSGYTSAPTVAISGSLGATAEAVLTAAGAVSHVIVTAEGAGYDSASLPTISFSGGGGSGAAATAIVQPKTAILTSQKKTELPDSDPMASEYIQVLRTYEVLPGPYLPFTRWSELLGPIQGTRRAVVWASQVATFTATAKTTYEAREGSSYVAWEIVETNSNGTGSAGNPAYPIYIDDLHDNERGEVQKTTQVVVKTGSEVSSSTVSGGIVTHIDYVAIDGDEFHLKKIIETWAVPRTLLGQNYDKTFDVLLPYSKIRNAAGTSLGVAHAEVTPVGDGTDSVIIPDIAALTTAMAAYSLSFPGVANIQLPDELISVVAVMETTSVEGNFSESGTGFSENSGWNLSIQGNGQGTAVVMPDIIPVIKQKWARNVPTTHYLFFLAAPVTTAAILSKLSTLGVTVSAWPKFNPRADTIICTGQKVTVRSDATAQSSRYASSTAAAASDSHGAGGSREIGITIKSIHLPATIHGAITVSGSTSQTQDATSVAFATTGLTASDNSEAATATGVISPASLNATDGDYTIPSSGLYLFGVDAEPYQWGYVQVRTEIVNAADW